MEVFSVNPSKSITSHSLGYTTVHGDERTHWFPPFEPIVDMFNHLKKKSRQISWAIVNNGVFLDMVFHAPFFFNDGECSSKRFNGGDVRIDASTYYTISKTILGILKQPERVQNNRVFVRDLTITQNEALEMPRKYLPAEQLWGVSDLGSGQALEERLKGLEEGNRSHKNMSELIAAATYQFFDQLFAKPDKI